MTIQSFLPWVDAGEAPTGGPNPGPLTLTYRAIHDRDGDNETIFIGQYPATPAVADRNLPNHIDYEPFYHLEWEVSFNYGDTWFPIGNTSNEVYVTLATPTGQRLESMYHIAITNSLNQTTAQGALSATWAKFATRSVQNKRGDTLGYYRGAGCPTPSATTARPLLINKNGECGAWVQLFGNCVRIHDSQPVFQTLVEPDPTQFNYQCDPVLALQNAWEPTLRMMINNWVAVNPPSSGCPTFPYRINSICQAWQSWTQIDVDDMAGLPGQDQAEPISIFGSHLLVRIGNLYYDPSYGSGPYPSVLDWENASVAGYAARIDNNHLRRGASLDEANWQQVTEMDEPIAVEAE
jgi:hypothetical protein